MLKDVGTGEGSCSWRPSQCLTAQKVLPWLCLHRVETPLFTFAAFHYFLHMSAVNPRLPRPSIPRLWSRYWLISVMSALGCRKKEVTSNLLLCSPLLQMHLLGCQLKPLERLPRRMGAAGESEVCPLRMFINCPIYFQLSEKPANSQQSPLSN